MSERKEKEGRKMRSAGYFEVNEEILKQFNKEEAKEFLWEMLNYGGRISHYGYEYWMKWVEENLRD